MRRAEYGDNQDTGTTILGALIAGFDLFRSPLRLELGPKLEHDLDELSNRVAQQVLFGASGTRGRWETGLWYTGRSNLTLGVAYIGTLGDEQTRHRAALRVGYFW